MDNRNEAREFLTSRRARPTPEQAGFPVGSNKWVTGLRRSEVAMLADVSIEYCSKVERGNLADVSDAVLDATARALQLDDAEREHLFDSWAATVQQAGTTSLTDRTSKENQP